MRRKKPISKRLFKPYALLFGVFLCVLLAAFIAYGTVNIEGNLVKTKQQLSASIQQNIENYFEQMNSFSLDLLNSREFCSTAIEELPKAAVGKSDGRGMGDAFTTLYAKAYKMIEQGYKVGIITDSQYYIWLGSSYFIHPLKGNLPNVYKDYIDLGHMTILRLETNPYLEQALQSTAKSTAPLYERDRGEVITLSRSIGVSGLLNSKQAMLEVQVPLEELSQLIDGLSTQGDSGVQISLYDSGGRPLYEQFPLESDQFINGLIEEGWHRVGDNMVEVMPVFSGNLFVVSRIPVARHYRTMTLFLVCAIGASLLLVGLLLFITYRLSRRISRPVGEMCRQIEKIQDNVSTRQTLEKVETDIDELDFLAQTISDLQGKLRNSLDEIVRLESYEIQSQLLALQTQMQPHFLYNTLMTVVAMGEVNGDREVVEICRALTGMLRYIASKNSLGVPIAEELAHLENYIQIMKVRFSRATMHIDIPVQMTALKIPKLIIQPLVENSFKYCERADCQIDVTGWMEGNQWRIRVSDNGQGFTAEKIDELRQRLSRIDNDRSLASQEINGMGLENIYMRLRLHYKENMHFQILQNPGGGACVEIGGLADNR